MDAASNIDSTSPVQPPQKAPDEKPVVSTFAGLKIGKASTEGKPNMNIGGSSIGGGSLADRV